MAARGGAGGGEVEAAATSGTTRGCGATWGWPATKKWRRPERRGGGGGQPEPQSAHRAVAVPVHRALLARLGAGRDDVRGVGARARESSRDVRPGTRTARPRRRRARAREPHRDRERELVAVREAVDLVEATRSRARRGSGGSARRAGRTRGTASRRARASAGLGHRGSSRAAYARTRARTRFRVGHVRPDARARRGSSRRGARARARRRRRRRTRAGGAAGREGGAHARAGCARLDGLVGRTPRSCCADQCSIFVPAQPLRPREEPVAEHLEHLHVAARRGVRDGRRRAARAGGSGRPRASIGTRATPSRAIDARPWAGRRRA